MRGRFFEVVGVTALAASVTLILAFPVLCAPSERIFGAEIVGRSHDPFTVMEQFEQPIRVSAYLQPITDLPGALLARVTGGVAAYNLLVLLSFPLSAATAYLLARHLTLTVAGGALVAIAFAFSPFHLAHAAYHPHIAQTQWVPLYLLALWRCLDRATPAAIGFLAVATMAVTLSNFYAGWLLAVLTPIAVTAYWYFACRSGRRSIRHLAITVAVLAMMAASGVVYAWLTARDVVLSSAEYAFPRADLFRYSAKWWSYLVPPVENPLLGTRVLRLWNAAGVRDGLLEQQVSLGWGVVALGLVATISWLARDRRTESLARVPILATVAFAALVCSLSPERTIGSFHFMRPSALMYAVAPMFRAYARFGVVVQLMAALLAGIGFDRLRHSGSRSARVAGAVLLVLAGAEYLVLPSALWRDTLPTSAHRWVTRQTPPLRVLDCSPLTPGSASVEWLTDGKISLLSEPTEDCTDPDLSERLSAAGYTHLILRSGTWESRWLAGHPPDGLRLQARFDDAELFAVSVVPAQVHTAELRGFQKVEHDEHARWRWMGADASWRVANSSLGTLVADLEVELAPLDGVRRLVVLLDGRQLQRLVVENPRRLYRIGPIALTPGSHELAFHSLDAPTVADEVLGNGDRRSLSVSFGTWSWSVRSEQR